MNDYFTSLIRTWVPLGVGAILSWLASLGLELGAEAEVGLVTFGTALITGVYYLIVRALEEKWPAFGKLLGKKALPVYAHPER
jgi:hypothetical protein